MTIVKREGLGRPMTYGELDGNFDEVERLRAEAAQSVAQSGANANASAASAGIAESARDDTLNAAAQVEADLVRVIKAPEGDVLGELPVAAGRNDTLLGFDTNGQPIVYPVADFVQYDENGNIPLPVEIQANTRELWRRTLADAGITLVSGSFQEGATVQNANEAVWDIDGAQCYTWSGGFPHDAESTPGVGWVSVGGLSFRDEISNKISQIKTLYDYGATCDGVNDDSPYFTKMANDLGYIVIPDNSTAFLANSVTLPLGMGNITANRYASLRISNGSRIYFTSPPTGNTKVLDLVCGQPWVVSDVDLAGKYLEITNSKQDYVMLAETAPANTIDIMELSKSDNNFGTLRSCLFKVVKYDNVSKKAYLDITPNFSAPGAISIIYDNVNHVKISNIHFIDENTGNQDTDGVLRFRRNYGGGIENCSGRINYPEISYFSNFNKITNNNFEIGSTFMVSWNCYCNEIVGNSITTPNLDKDGVIILFKNCCRNIVSNNIVNGESSSGYHWGIIFHTHCDYNISNGNKVSARHGIGDYAFNKGNMITNNNIECFSLANMGVIWNHYTDNTITIRSGAENTVSYDIDMSRNTFIYVGVPGTSSSGCVNLYDVGTKPFGWAGFISAPTIKLSVDGCKFKYIDTRPVIDYTTLVDFTKSPDSYIPSTITGMINGGVAGVFGYVQGTRSLSAKHITCNNLNVGFAILCVNAGTNFIINTGCNVFENVDCAYLVKSTTLNNNTRGLISDGDTFITCDIACMSSNYPAYITSAKFNGVSSAIVQCGSASNVYTAILDKNCISPGTGSFKGVNMWYNFLTSKPSAPNYDAQLTSSSAHPLTFRIPYGAEYYQPNPDMGVPHVVYFVNRSTPGNLKTVAVSISETSYT